MARFQAIFFAAAGAAWLLPASGARAQSAPPLNSQQVWTEKDKADFLHYLDSNAPMPSGGQVKAAGRSKESWSYREAQAIEIGPASTMIFPFTGNGHATTVAALPGVRVLYEKHFFPWLRGYGGLEGEALRQTRTDGAQGKLTRWAVPLGVEFALVPLATPQTRYVLLRLGLAVSDVAGADKRSSFAAPILGTSAAWDLGLGYEWQIPDTTWRLNAALDGLRSMGDRGGVGYYGLGMTLAAAYTF